MKMIYFIRIVLIIIILMWMSTIFGFSAENGESSQSLSDKITIRVVKIIESDYDNLSIEKQDNLFSKTSFIIRKIGHFGEYGILGCLFAIFAFTFKKYQLCSFRRKLLVEIPAIIYASTDEIHQFFVEGRASRVYDVVIDSSGAFCGIIFIIIISYLINHFINRKIDKLKQMNDIERAE